MLKIDSVGIEDKEIILSFIRDNSRKFAREFYHNPLIGEKAVVEYMLREIMEKLQNGVALCARDGSALRALGVISASKWDSRILGKNIGKFTLYILLSGEEAKPFLQEVYAEAQEMGFDAIFGRTDLGRMVELQSAMLNGAVLGDILLTLGMNLNRQQNENALEKMLPVKRSDLIFVEGTTANERELRKITESAYKHSHYFNDPHIPSGRAEAVYQEWIRNSLRGFADLTIVAKFKEETVGYITFRVKRLNEKAFETIDLIAVDKNYRGQSIGKMLVIEGIKRVSSRTDTLLVSTQVSNLPALRLYHSLGFEPILSEATFHVWFKTQNRVRFLEAHAGVTIP